jgi:hypothetical protein
MLLIAIVKIYLFWTSKVDGTRVGWNCSKIFRISRNYFVISRIFVWQKLRNFAKFLWRNKNFYSARYIFEYPFILRPAKRKLLCQKSVNFCMDPDPFFGNRSEDPDPPPPPPSGLAQTGSGSTMSLNPDQMRSGSESTTELLMTNVFQNSKNQ